MSLKQYPSDNVFCNGPVKYTLWYTIKSELRTFFHYHFAEALLRGMLATFFLSIIGLVGYGVFTCIKDTGPLFFVILARVVGTVVGMGVFILAFGELIRRKMG